MSVVSSKTDKRRTRRFDADFSIRIRVVLSSRAYRTGEAGILTLLLGWEENAAGVVFSVADFAVNGWVVE
jgi:hypothetical protein